MTRVIMFQPQFAQLVLHEEKHHTIRGTARCKPGDQLSLRRWTGKPYRSKQETLRNVICKMVLQVTIGGGDSNDGISIDDIECTPFTRELLAINDGFKSASEMLSWFQKTHGLPFSGQLISWMDMPEYILCADTIDKAKAEQEE